ncbi:hypothetical protein PPL_11041 [Heterostelium album PN500]|uniref:Ankyrin repeat protein n=1 Tax=Heterostelium pallidum (strain ATCC 26659 / Pp 5 / PN500) TaxID=670386 RepID=D3BSS1_HETP5|nr:hypothetical protein PPL_11041 [Heterostelium album PN500]EFA75536.1 hypothetical protein PPL_11041 [Heterostelium album PN500]|eukprot:XP_020427670.1 hypothetical protein PPL_11041 [Heterostelium album PN500]
MDNKIFNNVFNNMLLRNYIFQQVRSIHVDYLKEKSFKWKEVACKPYLLAGYNYFQLLKEYYNVVANRNISLNISFVYSPLEKDNSLGYALRIAVRKNRSEILKYFMAEHKLYLYLDELMISAATSGNFEALQYLDSIAPQLKSDNLYRSRIIESPFGKNIEMMHWLIENKMNFDPIVKRMVFQLTIRNALEAGFVGILDYLIDKSELTEMQGVSDDIMMNAVKSGSIATVEWLISKGYQCKNSSYITCAAKHCHLELVQYLHGKGVVGSCTKEVMESAIGSGQVELIQWVHENKTEEWNRNAIKIAIEKNQLDSVRWLHKNKPDLIDKNILNQLLDDGKKKVSVNILQYLLDNRLYLVINNDRDTEMIMLSALCEGNYDLRADTLKFLLGNQQLLFNKSIDVFTLLPIAKNLSTNLGSIIESYI